MLNQIQHYGVKLHTCSGLIIGKEEEKWTLQQAGKVFHWAQDKSHKFWLEHSCLAAIHLMQIIQIASIFRGLVTPPASQNYSNVLKSCVYKELMRGQTRHQPLTQKCAYGFRANSASHNCSMPLTIWCSSVHLPNHSFGLGCWTVPNKLPREFPHKDTGEEGCVIWAEPIQPFPSRSLWIKARWKTCKHPALVTIFTGPIPNPDSCLLTSL